eukprot:9475266-Pyramimonas_sp.AAC.1
MQALVCKLVRKRSSGVGSEAATKGTRLRRGAATKGTLTGGVAGELAEHVLAEHQTEAARRPRQLPEVPPRVPEEHVRGPPQVDGHVELGTPGTDTPGQTREKGTR